VGQNQSPFEMEEEEEERIYQEIEERRHQ